MKAIAKKILKAVLVLLTLYLALDAVICVNKANYISAAVDALLIAWNTRSLLKGTPEEYLESATAGIAKYVAKYEKAVEAAKSELAAIDKMVATKVDKYDAKIESAYSKYMGVESKYVAKTSKVEAAADARQKTLNAVVEKAQKAIDNHNSIYLS